jgi:EAL domain-containing protein (putative c-di-GMP-specific phosphodiesterase class I)
MRFPFDRIKIDRSFTQDLYNSTGSMAVVSSVLTLARGLGIATTAEGVETEEQYEILRAGGVDLVQGYLFGRPCPASELDFSGASTGSTCEEGGLIARSKATPALSGRAARLVGSSL